MHISRHAKERYAKRIMDITDPKEVKRLARYKEEKIEKDINKLFEYSIYIATAELGKNGPKKFWIRDDIIIVTDKKIKCVITIYRLDYGYDHEVNRVLAREITDKILEAKSILKYEPDNEQAKEDLLYYTNRLLVCKFYAEDALLVIK